MPNAIGLMKDVIATYANNPKWVDAPLGDIKILSNTHIGNVGQDFIHQWCDVEDLNWELPKSTQSPWDIRIESISFEVKTATEDVNDKFQFNHIRHHRDYQALLVLGIAPDEILFNAWRKGDVVEGKAGRLVTMDKGSSATFKLTKKPAELFPITEFTHRINEIARSLV
ncbi:hypothetical protein C6503_06110 [Candidatus Poribacteria bacterium]|nr:MAG: hypothetical protein C6503_06110 [Candidatus Poribacteria bacterium]